MKVSLSHPGQKIPANTLYYEQIIKELCFTKCTVTAFFQIYFQDLTKVCSKLYSRKYFANAQSEQPTFNDCFRA